MSERVALVTGGAGFIGSHLVDGLLEAGFRVRVLDDLSSGREANLAGSRDAIEFVHGDVCDRALLEKAVSGAELVFHEAAIPSVPVSVAEPVRTNRANVTGTLEVLEAARQAGVRRVVFAASSSAYGDTPELPKIETMPATPQSPYALQKYTGETYCGLYHQLYGLETVALRYFNIFGPRQNPESEYAAVIPRFAVSCLTNVPARIHGDGEQTRDFTFVGDAVRANLLAADAPNASGSVINVAGGERVSLNQVLDLLREVTGANAPAIHEPPRVGDVRDSLADLGRARDLLGYEPTIDLKEGLRATAESLRDSLQNGESS